MNDRRKEDSWHLDKRVPIVLILAILGQTGAALKWAGTIDNRVTQLEQRASSNRDMKERVIRVEERISSMNAILADIRDELKRR